MPNINVPLSDAEFEAAKRLGKLSGRDSVEDFFLNLLHREIKQEIQTLQSIISGVSSFTREKPKKVGRLQSGTVTAMALLSAHSHSAPKNASQIMKRAGEIFGRKAPDSPTKFYSPLNSLTGYGFLESIKEPGFPTKYSITESGKEQAERLLEIEKGEEISLFFRHANHPEVIDHDDKNI